MGIEETNRGNDRERERVKRERVGNEDRAIDGERDKLREQGCREREREREGEREREIEIDR